MGDLVVRMNDSRHNRKSNDCRTRGLRYYPRMKKPNLAKLAVHRETLRALASIELTRAAGGNEPFSGAVLCPAPVASGVVTCPAPAVIALPSG